MRYILICTIAFSFLSCRDQEIVNEPPPAFALSQNFPNPFTDTTAVIYDVPYIAGGHSAPWVRVVVNDRFNDTWAVLVDVHSHPAGTGFRTVWNGRGNNYQPAPAGIYYIELQQLNYPDYEEPYIHSRKVALKQ